MRSYKKQQRKSTVVAPNYNDLRRRADSILRRWVSGKYVGMPNMDLREPGDPENDFNIDDKEVELCHRLAQRWSLSDKLIAKNRWGADESKATITAISRRIGFGRTKVENRIIWMQDCVIESCVKNVNIYP